MRDRFIACLCRLAERNDRIILVTGDLGFRVFDEYRARFPLQFLNVGVAEQNMIGVATGLALEGRIPFCYSIGNFSTLRCLEQIRNDACYHDANVNVVCMGGGFSYGALGISHHATEDLAIMRAIPGITVLAPGDLWEASEAAEALVSTPGAGYLRLDKSSAGDTQRPGEIFQIGKARVLRKGEDAALVASGGILEVALEAADSLAPEGIYSTVLSVHSLKPFDVEAICEVAEKTGGIVTLEEHTALGGLGGLVAETLLEEGVYPGFFYRMGLRSEFSSVVGTQEYLRQHYGLDKEAVKQKVRALVKRSIRGPLRVARADVRKIY